MAVKADHESTVRFLSLSEPDASFGCETGLILRRDPESSYLDIVLRIERLVCFTKTQDIFQDDPC